MKTVRTQAPGLKTRPPYGTILLAISLAAGVLVHAQLGRTTPLFVCGTDETLPDPIPVRWDTVALAGDGRLYSPCPAAVHTDRHREVREAAVLQAALRSPQPELRRLAVQAYGRFGTPVTAMVLLSRPVAPPPVGAGGTVFSPLGPPSPGATRASLLDDRVPRVRRDVANAVGDLLSAPSEMPWWRPVATAPVDAQLNFARVTLIARLSVETDDDVAATILETLGRMKHPDEPVLLRVEGILVAQSTANATRLVGAVKGLAAFIKNNPQRDVSDAVRERLRQWAILGPTQAEVPTVAGPGTAEAPGDESSLAQVRRVALQTMAAIRDDDLETLLRAAQDADWQVRRVVAARMDVTKPEFLATYLFFAADAAFQVRYEAVAAVARRAEQTHDCRRLFGMVSDPEAIVAMRAIDLLPENCANHEEIVTHLVTLAERLQDSGSGTAWHVPARALVALARLAPASARPLFERTSGHQDWHVRAATATAAGHLRDPAVLGELAQDRESNVRTAALEAMMVAKAPEITAAAIEALKSEDNQLLRTAAVALKPVPDDQRVVACNALLIALFRLTRAASDTSREARVAITESLEAIPPPECAGRPSGLEGQVRYPLQPTSTQLQKLPSAATITVDGLGTLELTLLSGQAPVTVARFTELALAGYYNGLTFHRVLPNFLVQTGSPNANDFSGTDRFWRDETSTEPHTRGAITLATRGRDAGDGQFFIELVDVLRFDHDRTVFARVVSGYNVLDQILEGVRISTVTVR